MDTRDALVPGVDGRATLAARIPEPEVTGLSFRISLGGSLCISLSSCLSALLAFLSGFLALCIPLGLDILFKQPGFLIPSLSLLLSLHACFYILPFSSISSCLSFCFLCL